MAVLESLGIRWPTRDKILRKLHSPTNIANPDTLTIMRDEQLNLEARNTRSLAEPTETEQERDVLPQLSTANIDDQLQHAPPITPATPTHHQPLNEENQLKKWEKKKRERDRKHYDRNMRFQVTLAISFVLAGEYFVQLELTLYSAIRTAMREYLIG
jgi:hypothetical protein